MLRNNLDAPLESPEGDSNAGMKTTPQSSAERLPRSGGFEEELRNQGVDPNYNKN
ncbi:MAG: hypothetical protein ABIC82_05930 [bacterium]